MAQLRVDGYPVGAARSSGTSEPTDRLNRLTG